MESKEESVFELAPPSISVDPEYPYGFWDCAPVALLVPALIGAGGCAIQAIEGNVTDDRRKFLKWLGGTAISGAGGARGAYCMTKNAQAEEKALKQGEKEEQARNKKLVTDFLRVMPLTANPVDGIEFRHESIVTPGKRVITLTPKPTKSLEFAQLVSAVRNRSTGLGGYIADRLSQEELEFLKMIEVREGGEVALNFSGNIVVSDIGSPGDYLNPQVHGVTLRNDDPSVQTPKGWNNPSDWNGSYERWLLYFAHQYDRTGRGGDMQQAANFVNQEATLVFLAPVIRKFASLEVQKHNDEIADAALDAIMDQANQNSMDW